ASRRGKVHFGLSSREEETVRLVEVGLSTTEIAHDIALSRSRVRGLISSAARKLGVRGREGLLLARRFAAGLQGLQRLIRTHGTAVGRAQAGATARMIPVLVDSLAHLISEARSVFENAGGSHYVVVAGERMNVFDMTAEDVFAKLTSLS